jgi:hypothetical protein
MTEQECRIKALEIAASLYGPTFPVLYQDKSGELKIYDGFNRILKGIERYIDGEKPTVFFEQPPVTTEPF